MSDEHSHELCPRCGKDYMGVGVECAEYTGLFYVACDGCGIRGPSVSSEKEAVAEWNKMVKAVNYHDRLVKATARLSLALAGVLDEYEQDVAEKDAEKLLAELEGDK